eukprot:1043926-Amphidinium_carterae.1
MRYIPSKNAQKWKKRKMGNVRPAILVYYAPALMQKNFSTDPVGALTVLAEVFRQVLTGLVRRDH